MSAKRDSATIVWMRQDLRLADNPALLAASQRGGPIIPVFIWAPDEEAPWQPGAARRWWLHQSLTALQNALRQRHSDLIIRTGPSVDALRELVEQTGADAVYWNRRYEPAITRRDRDVKTTLRSAGLTVESFNSHLLYEPWHVSTQAGKPYRVYSPFWRACGALPRPAEPCDTPQAWSPPGRWPRSLSVDDLGLMPKVAWYDGIAEAWEPGEAGALRRLETFLDEGLDDYAAHRDRPDVDGTSRLSPHLTHGEIGPRQVYHAVRKRSGGKGADKFIAELGWREFAYHVLFHFPHTPQRPLQEKYADFPWVDMRKGRHQLEAWQQGRTGYPMVDAGMRQLWRIGYMHNRVRMIVASFLVKDLLISWEHGARWFWDTLVDADLANNTLGWQWAGGCGADAAPYFRIFNPVTQGKKFDPRGDYVRQWIDALSDADGAEVHEPWKSEGDRNGDYPEPMVDHREARERALAALGKVTE